MPWVFWRGVVFQSFVCVIHTQQMIVSFLQFLVFRVAPHKKLLQHLYYCYLFAVCLNCGLFQQMNFREKGKTSFHIHGKVMISMFSSLFLASISRKGKVFTERVLAKQQFPFNLLYSHSLCLSRGLTKRSLFFSSLVEMECSMNKSNRGRPSLFNWTWENGILKWRKVRESCCLYVESWWKVPNTPTVKPSEKNTA